MAFGPITSWQTDEEAMETVTDFIFLGSKITADGDCSHEIKRRLLFGRKAMTNLDSILKIRDYFADKIPSSQRFFSSSHVWMWELDHRKAEHWRTDAFEFWCWRGLLRVPWTARRSNQSMSSSNCCFLTCIQISQETQNPLEWVAISFSRVSSWPGI